jgi:2-desacetyl-2-hydroxyethyl bacteriochlorophyllide A dehydrogenase
MPFYFNQLFRIGVMQRTSVIFKKPYEIEIIKSPMPVPEADEVLVKTRVSAVSAGTELLVYCGRFPASMPVDATIPTLARPFGYPLAYGYASVGQVIEVGRAAKKELLNQPVFCFHPHESHYTIHQDHLIPLPGDIEPIDAAFLAAMETAVNFLMDGRPVIGERVAVFGLGVVGLLTTALLAQLPLDDLAVLDPCALRRRSAEDAGSRITLDPEAADALDGLKRRFKSDNGEAGADLIYELSGNPAALNQAIGIAGTGARIVIGSWYGNKKAELDLGGSFHRNRIKLISSQVSTIAPRLTARWSKTRRLTVALDMIRQVNPGRFVTHRFDVHQAAEAYELLDKRPHETIQVLLTYK